jgi:hypothetical protein
MLTEVVWAFLDGVLMLFPFDHCVVIFFGFLVWFIGLVGDSLAFITVFSLKW